MAKKKKSKSSTSSKNKVSIEFVGLILILISIIGIGVFGPVGKLIKEFAIFLAEVLKHNGFRKYNYVDSTTIGYSNEKVVKEKTFSYIRKLYLHVNKCR